MPTYRWQCFECGLQFEASVPMTQRDEKRPCPACKTQAERIVPVEVAGMFNRAVEGPGPQNSGVSQLDANIDRVIGTHAQQGWEQHRQREVEKRKALAGVPTRDVELAKNPDGSYRVMSREEQAIHGRALTIHNLAMLRRKTKPTPPR